VAQAGSSSRGAAPCRSHSDIYMDAMMGVYFSLVAQAAGSS
jgi:hypothetical protein